MVDGLGDPINYAPALPRGENPYAEKAFELLGEFVAKYGHLVTDEAIDRMIGETLDDHANIAESIEVLKNSPTQEQFNQAVLTITQCVRKLQNSLGNIEAIRIDLSSVYEELQEIDPQSESDKVFAANFSHTIKNDLAKLLWAAGELESEQLIEQLNQLTDNPEPIDEVEWLVDYINEAVKELEKVVVKSLYLQTDLLKGLNKMFLGRNDLIGNQKIGYMDRGDRASKFLDAAETISALTRGQEINWDDLSRLSSIGVDPEEIRKQFETGELSDDEEGWRKFRKEMLTHIKTYQEPWEVKFNQLEAVGLNYYSNE